MSEHTSVIHTADNGAKVEVGTFVFQGKAFSAMGSVVDETRGVVCAYVGGVPGAYRLTTWGGEVIAPLRLVRTWLNRNTFGGWPVKMYAWSCKIGDRVYSGRNAGPCMFVRMRAGRTVES